MGPDFSIEMILDALADRVAERINRSGNAAAITPRLLDVNEAARYLNRSPSAVRHLESTEVLKSVRLDGRVFFDIRDLDAVIERAKDK